MAVLEAVDAWDAAHPVIVVSSLEEAYVRPIALAHGAEVCFGKPITSERLRNAIQKVCYEDRGGAGCRCDRWGHPCRGLKSWPGGEQESAIFAECK
jgi:DNA-binding response OmpR family regulator